MINKNTVEGALNLCELKSNSNINRFNHTLTVAENCEKLARLSTLTNEQKDVLYMAAYLHDIGYSEELKLTGFHPYDGYTYLSNNGWHADVCLLVLHHSEAVTVPRAHNEIIDKVYQTPMPSHLAEQYQILAIADMTSSGIGKQVTFEERVQDIKDRYGEDSPIVEHSTDLSYKVLTWLLELKLGSTIQTAK